MNESASLPAFPPRYWLVGAAALALAASGCEGGHYHYGYYAPVCESGTTVGDIEADAILELDAGYGVAATAEYAGDGGWRFAVTCDTALTGYGCDWTVLVSSIDGSIESFVGEGLERGDLVERYPTNPDSTEEDGVALFSYTDVGIDAFTVIATPGAGMRVVAELGGFCAGPLLYWTQDGDVVSSRTLATDLYPFPPDS